MPVKGQILRDDSSGNQYEFLETAADSGGDRVVVLQTVTGTGKQVPDHLHAFQSEVFEVLEGTLTYLQNGKIKTASKGEKVHFPVGQPHNHYNASGSTLVVKHTTEPALDFEYLLENLVGLSADGVIKKGKVPFLQAIVSQRTLDSRAYLAFPPVIVQKILGFVLAPIGRLLGYRAIYAKYSDFEK